jgi:DNA mismatch repair ATPase MutS
MTDLQQVALAMKLATRRSLIIIDEFGKGTDASGRRVIVTYSAASVIDLII